MARTLGKRKRSSYRGGGMGRKRKRTKYSRSGNVRTGGLYRLRGRTRGKRLAQAELKFFDRNIISDAGGVVNDSSTLTYWRNGGGVTVNALMDTGRWYCNLGITEHLAQGANAFERIGRKVIVKSLLVDLLPTYVPNNNVDSVMVRFLIVWDKQCNGSAPDFTQLFSNPGGIPGTVPSSGAQVPCITELPAIANRQRYQILKEKYMVLASNTDTQIVQRSLKCYLKLNIPIEYGGTTTAGAIGDIKSNNIFLAIAGCKTNGTQHEAVLSCNGTIRVRFSDI